MADREQSMEEGAPEKRDPETTSSRSTLSLFSKMYDMNGDVKLDDNEKALRDIDRHEGKIDIERTAWAATVLAQDTQTEQGSLVDKRTGLVVMTGSYVRENAAADQQGSGRRNQEGAVSAEGSTITRSAAADLFNYCAQGAALINVNVAEGKQVLAVCPADSYVQEENSFAFLKGSRDLQITCPVTERQLDEDSDHEEEGNNNCVMTGTMLIRPTKENGKYAPFPVMAYGGKVFGKSFPNYNDVVLADYEVGSVTSGISGLVGSHATAHDAVYVATFGHHSNRSVCHKALLDDTDYHYLGNSGSESDTMDIFSSRYYPGTEFIYKFSLRLHEWEDYVDVDVGQTTPIDIVWQLKNTNGGPDILFAVWGNDLVLRYGLESTQVEIVPNVQTFKDQWMGIETRVKWEEGATGFITLTVQTPDSYDPVEVFRLENTTTFTKMGIWRGDFGYPRWGVYRPGPVAADNHNERIACHDNVRVTAVTY